MNYIKTEEISENAMYLLVERDKETGLILRAIRTYYIAERAKQDLELLLKHGAGNGLYEYFQIARA